MDRRREDHQRVDQELAKKSLEDLSRRWSFNPNVYYWLLLVALVCILILVFL